MARTVPGYKSPAHKVIALLKTGRDKLREKYRTLRKDFRRAQNQNRAVTKSREAWRERAQAAEAELRELKKVPAGSEPVVIPPEPSRAESSQTSSDIAVVPKDIAVQEAQPDSLPVVGSSFDVMTIVKTLRLVLFGALSLRAAARACNIIDECDGGLGIDGPCQTTIQNHLPRVGLYLLTRDDQVRSDWVWLLDHTVNAGTTKCLIVLGIPLEDYQKISRPLGHQDLTAIGVLPVETSNGEVVRGQLEQLSERLGTPVATLSDRGSDLKKGVELFQEDHPKVISVYDVVHLVSRRIKNILEPDPRWAEYRTACCACANKLRQSSLAHLKPPRPKPKARYMNYDHEVRWAMRALLVLDRVREGRLNECQQKRLPRELVEKQLGWLEEYREDVSRWMEIIWAGKAIHETVRQNGYSTRTAEEVRQLKVHYNRDETLEMVDNISNEMSGMCDSLDEGVNLPGSTEVLESIIGKGKRLLGHGGNSLTKHILSIAAATTRITTTLVRTALKKCGTKNLTTWAKKNLVPGIHTARKEDLVQTEEEQNLRKVIQPATPNF